MIKKLLVSIMLLATMFETAVFAVDFANKAEIEVSGSKRYKAVRLTPQIYNYTRANFADLMLLDKNNEPIPFFINSYAENSNEIKNSYEMVKINSFVKDEYFYYDYALKSPIKEDVIATSIEVGTDKNGFAKKVELYGGYDNVNWEKVQDEILYNVDGSKKLEISFNNVKKYTYYRFKIANNLEKISFSTVVLYYNKTFQTKEYFVNTFSPGFTTEERGKATVIKVPEFKNLKLSSITLKTDSMFKRYVTFDGRTTKMLYNLEFEKTEYRDLTIPLGAYKVTADTAEIVIDNKDDKPINILGIEARYLYDELVFDGSKAGEYILSFGSSEAQSPKSYDISNYREQILREGYDVSSIGEVRTNIPIAPSKPKYDYKLIFNITVSLVALAMGFIVLLKLKKV